jgi:hypothetical protein
VEGEGIVCMIDITLCLQDDDIIRPHLIVRSLSNTPGESGIWRNRSSTSLRTHIHPTESHLIEGTYVLKPRLSSLYYTKTITTRLIYVGLLVAQILN